MRLGLKEIAGALVLGMGIGGMARADPLPYWVSLETPVQSTFTVLSLRGISDRAANAWSKLPVSGHTLAEFQSLFEQELWAAVKNLAPNRSSSQFKRQTVKALSKWLSVHATDPSVSSDDLESFQEYLRSMAFLQSLNPEKMVAADLDKPEFLKQSRWCGSPQDPGCEPGILFKDISVNYGGPDNLYAALAGRLADAVEWDTRGRQVTTLSYQLLWNPPLTQVRYGITFFFEEFRAPKASQAKLLGYDLVYVNEATPAPLSPAASGEEPVALSTKAHAMTPKEMVGLLGRVSAYPIGVAIGVKNAAFEVAKMPFSFIAGFFGRGKPWEYPYRNLKSAHVALKMEVIHPQKVGLLRGLARLVGETPIVGTVFQINTNPNRTKTGGTKRIYLTRGIYGGGRLEQDTGLWEAATQHLYPEAYVHAAPYEFGTVTDVVWSMFNLSHGPAYTLADQVMESAGPSDRLYFAGHSAGVQRITVASRILTHQGYDVRQMMGVAGPSIGQACVNTLHPRPFEILINPSGDIVSAIGLGAKSLATLADIGTRRPVKFVGGILLRYDRQTLWRWNWLMDRMGISNATKTIVRQGAPAKHETPLRLSLTQRVVFDRFIRQEFADIFRDDRTAPPSKSPAISYRD